MNRDQTLELHSRGKEAWNAWALSLLQRRKQLERAELGRGDGCRRGHDWPQRVDVDLVG